MAIVFLMNEEIAHGMVCFFHQKKHSYLIKKISSNDFFLTLMRIQLFHNSSGTFLPKLDSSWDERMAQAQKS
jgi:peptidyl-tRNA hydrolase